MKNRRTFLHFRDQVFLALINESVREQLGKNGPKGWASLLSLSFFFPCL